MESTHGKLGTGLADGLGGYDADSLAGLNGRVRSHILAVAFCAYAVTRVTAEHRTYGYLLDTSVDYILCESVGHETVLGNDYVAVCVLDVLRDESALNSVFEPLDNFAVGAYNGFDNHTAGLFTARHTVVFTHDYVLRNVYEPTRKITRVGCFKRRIRKSFTSAVRGNEVFENGKSLSETRLNGNFNLFTLRVNHQSAHTRKLFHLVNRTAGTRVRHHPYGVEFVQRLFKRFGNSVGSAVPRFDNRVVALFLSQKSALILLFYLDNLVFGFLYDFLFSRRNMHIENGSRYRAYRGILVSQRLYLVKHVCRSGCAARLETALYYLAELFFANRNGAAEELVRDFVFEVILFLPAVYETEILRHIRVEDYPADGGLDSALNFFAEIGRIFVFDCKITPYVNFVLHMDKLGLVSH